MSTNNNIDITDLENTKEGDYMVKKKKSTYRRVKKGRKTTITRRSK